MGEGGTSIATVLAVAGGYLILSLAVGGALNQAEILLVIIAVFAVCLLYPAIRNAQMSGGDF